MYSYVELPAGRVGAGRHGREKARPLNHLHHQNALPTTLPLFLDLLPPPPAAASTMQLGTAGVRPALGRATNRVLNNNSLFTRSFHVPPPHSIPHPPPPVRSAPASTAQRVVKTTRTLVSRFFQHLASPGLHVPVHTVPSHAGTHALHVARPQTIQQGFSLPVRHALNKPLGTPFLPRAPIVPRGTTQVGLGTARAFHSGRPIFQSLAENVPIVTRTLFEADIDTRKRAGKSKAAFMATKQATKTAEKGKGPRAKENIVVRNKKVTKTDAACPEELDIYLPIAPIAPVTTRVLIPLAPTPTGRTPLTPSGARPGRSTSERLLPLATLSATHAAHTTHSTRVASLFARLDNARVWDDPHVRYSAHALGTSDGTCTMLEIVFDGWDEARVRAVLGDAGRGWCEVCEDMRTPEDSVLADDPQAPVSVSGDHAVYAEIDRWFSGLESRPFSPEPERVLVELDPSHSFVLPTLDFSASAVDFAGASTTAIASEDDWDAFSDAGLSDASFSDGTFSDAGSDNASMFGLSAPPSHASTWVGVGFSSHFYDTVQAQRRDNQPMEALF